MKKEIYKALANRIDFDSYSAYINSLLKKELNNVIFDLSISNRCDLKCKHCYIGSVTNYEKPLSNAEWIKLMLELSMHGTPRFNLSGKEITQISGFDVFFQELKKIKHENNITFGTITNGNGTLEQYRQILNSGADYLEFSIDGLSYEHVAVRNVNNLKSIENKITTLIEEGFSEKISICTTLRNSNTQEYHSLIEYYSDLNVHYFFADPMQPTGFGRNLKNNILSSKDYFLFLKESFDYLSLPNNKGKNLNLYYCIPQIYIKSAINSPILKDWIENYVFQGKSLFWSFNGNSLQISLNLFDIPYLKHITISNDGFVLSTPMNIGKINYPNYSIGNITNQNIQKILKKRSEYIINYLNKIIV